MGGAPVGRSRRRGLIFGHPYTGYIFCQMSFLLGQGTAEGLQGAKNDALPPSR